jgi:hypothetical protein
LIGCGRQWTLNIVSTTLVGNVVKQKPALVAGCFFALLDYQVKRLAFEDSGSS